MKNKGPRKKKIDLEKEFANQEDTASEEESEDEPDEKGDEPMSEDEKEDTPKEDPAKQNSDDTKPDEDSPKEDPAEPNKENDANKEKPDEEPEKEDPAKQTEEDPKEPEQENEGDKTTPSEEQNKDPEQEAEKPNEDPDKDHEQEKSPEKEDNQDKSDEDKENISRVSSAGENSVVAPVILPGQIGEVEEVIPRQSQPNKAVTDGLTLHELLVKDLDLSTSSKVDAILASGRHKDINYRGKYGETCLHVLLTPRESDFTLYIVGLIYQLVREGASVNLQDRDGFTALHLAAWNDHDHRVAAALLKVGADPGIRNNKGEMALGVAEQRPTRRVIRMAYKGLGSAAEQRDVKETQELLHAWFSIIVQHKGKRVDDLATESNHKGLISLLEEQKATNLLVHAVLSGDAAATRKILAKGGANVNTRDQSYMRQDCQLSPMPLLAQAVMLGREETSRILYQVGKADANALIDTETGQEPLFYYLIKRAPPVSVELLALLVGKADVSLVKGKILSFLIDLGSRELPDDATEPLVQQALADAKVVLGQRGRDGYTLRDRLLLCSYRQPLRTCFARLRLVDMQVMRMARNGDEQALRKLLLAGYDYTEITSAKGTSIEDAAGKSKNIIVQGFVKDLPQLQVRRHAMHTAIEKGNLAEVKAAMKAGLTGACDQGGFYPLHKAVMYERRYIIKYILDTHPEEVNQRDTMGRIPLHYAWYLTNGQDIIESLRNSGSNESMKDVNGLVPGDLRGPAGHQALLKARQPPPGRATYLLNHYLRLLLAIEAGSLEQVSVLVSSAHRIPQQDMDEYLVRAFPNLDYVPPLYACVNQDREIIAVKLVQLGANHRVSYKVVLDANSPRNGEVMPLTGAATLKNMLKLLEAIGKDALEGNKKQPNKVHQDARRPNHPAVGGPQNHTSNPNVPGGNQDDQGDPSQPPPKKSSVCILL